MCVSPRGEIAETVGGGSGERRVIDAAVRALADGGAVMVHLEMWGDEKDGAGMVCGGFMDILVEPLVPGRDREWVGIVEHRFREGRPTRIERRLSTGDPPDAEVLVVRDETGRSLWRRPGAAEEDEAPRRGSAPPVLFLPGGEGEPDRVIEEVAPPEPLVIVGAGHVGEALCEVAAGLGFAVHVVDGRPEFAVPGRFPRATRVDAGDPAEILAGLPEDERGSYVLVGHGYGVDAAALRVLLLRKRRYIGMIGSRRRVETVKRVLLDEGFARAELDEVYGPIGFEIEAETPAEIAISIAAELVAVRRGVKAPAGSISRRAPEDEARGGR